MMRKLGVVVMVVLAVVLAACTTSPTVAPTTSTVPPTKPLATAVDLSATPTGWVSVALSYMQVSVPPSWYVLYDSPPCPTGSAPGEIFVNPSPGVFHCPPDKSGSSPQTVVQLRLEAGASFPSVPRYVRTINYLAVYSLSVNSGRSTYLVIPPAAEITLKGPLAQQVLNTLTLSPRFVPTSVGPAPFVPSSWRVVTFAGLRFSVPAVWPITRTSGAAFGLGSPCATPGVAFPDHVAPSVTLDTDKHFLPPPACPTETPLNQPPMNGVQVDSGSRMNFQVALSFSTHCFSLHSLTACPAISPAYSILVLKVTVGGLKPVYVSIGLAGNGMVARTILYSLWSA